jgi:hypothetical protein
MDLAKEIRELAGRTQESLNSSHDYFVHTKRVWQLMRETVNEGRRFSFQNKLTGTDVDERELVARSRRYLKTYLRSATFQHFVALFEDFFFDFLRLWLTAYPGSLSKKTLEFSTVLKAADKGAIVLHVVDKELNEIKYERVADWFAYLDKLARLDCPTPAEIVQFAEIKAARDILVHNKGVVNATYVEKSGSRARFRAGERLEMPEPYHRESWELIKKLIAEIATAALAKIGGES